MTDEERNEIVFARKAYERHCEQKEQDDIWDLAMRLHLDEDEVLQVWNGAA